MNSLPQELVDKIASFLDRRDLGAIVLLSRKLRYAAEYHSGAFAEARLKADSAVIRKFSSIYCGHRSSYLRVIVLDTSVPGVYDENIEYPEQDCRDTEKDVQTMTEAFSQEMSMLFSAISALEKHTHDLGKIHVIIHTPTRCGSTYHPEPEKLFECHIEYRTILDIARRCPNLDTLKCRLGGSEWMGNFKSQTLNESCQDWAGPRRDSRHGFENAVRGIHKALPRLRRVDLDFLFPLEWMEAFPERSTLPNLVHPAPYDPFSSSLRILSHHLRTMHLRVIADDTLFWPTENDNTSTWPNMESMNIMFCNSHPSGLWYISGQPSTTPGYEITPEHYPPLIKTDRDRENDEDDDAIYDWDSGDASHISHTRVFPQEPALTRFLRAFAKAAGSMPKLKDFVFWTPIKVHADDLEENFPALDPLSISRHARSVSIAELAWGIAYTAPGIDFPSRWEKSVDTSVRNLWWKVGDWRPEAELAELFHKIGLEEHRGQMSEHWNDVENQDNGLDYRDIFERWGFEPWSRTFGCLVCGG
ncbi:hypothetical protein DPSP01_014175 [Paraphaeosphaeria sporulosa]|uniref:F-box domain-containing protein n=1 Tax=Paraphaeosphaeria sporulosa TaxID=1460663 RepID=A0A177CG36_9PLEO|nr:uncharacterized protein CC84DRAFT_1244325 [Paraphaeosphaeria sporulosa]OAG05799.1 hypothetical protein CC84DRAFT_1244325 [Paraphaeosphaeria sporulosa]